MKYANISMEKQYQTEGNLGDYIQFITIDYIYELMGISSDEIIRIEYWDLMNYNGEECVLPINFFYFNPSKDKNDFVLSSKIHPVYLGVHLPNNISDKQIEAMLKNTPIGCRDENTYKIFNRKKNKNRENDVDIYLQGCITAILPKRREKNYKDIYIVDIPQIIQERFPFEIKDNAVRMTHLFYDKLSEELGDSKFNNVQEYVKNRFNTYRDNAKLVITSRMHCAIPCLAMGIPVIFIVPTMSPRFSWMEKLVKIYTYEDIDKIDWNPMCKEYEDIKKDIIELAITRIKGEYNGKLLKRVNDWYMDRIKNEDYDEEGIGKLYDFANKNWSNRDRIEYILWGVTATTEEVYNWITRQYDNAVLITVIDEYRELEFHGIKTERSKCISNYPNCYYIGTGASASIAMKKKLAVYGEEWLERAIPLIV